MMMLKTLVKKSTVRATAAGGAFPQTQISQLLKLTQMGSQRYFSSDVKPPGETVVPPKEENVGGDAKQAEVKQ